MTNWRIVLLLSAFSTLLAVYSRSGAPPRLQDVATAHQRAPSAIATPLARFPRMACGSPTCRTATSFFTASKVRPRRSCSRPITRRGTVIWFPDSRSLAVVEVPFGTGPQWFRYDVATGKREALGAPPFTGNQAAKPPSLSEKIWGATAYSPDRRSFYYSVPNARGTLDLWSRNLDTGDATQLTQFDRDTYDLSVTSRGDLLFKVQIFSAVVDGLQLVAVRHAF